MAFFVIIIYCCLIVELLLLLLLFLLLWGNLCSSNWWWRQNLELKVLKVSFWHDPNICFFSAGGHQCTKSKHSHPLSFFVLVVDKDKCKLWSHSLISYCYGALLTTYSLHVHYSGLCGCFVSVFLVLLSCFHGDCCHDGDGSIIVIASPQFTQ